MEYLRHKCELGSPPFGVADRVSKGQSCNVHNLWTTLWSFRFQRLPKASLTLFRVDVLAVVTFREGVEWIKVNLVSIRYSWGS